ncbi:MAG: urease accessory protein UreD [Actinomycetota bacterium]|nr:urease accessory protein UreD [Actinomycetota bacterium]
MRSRVRIAAAAGDSGTVLEELAGTEPWRPRLLARSGASARVALVQTRASILRGDAVELSISVGDGAVLELVEIGATLTHHARGGARAQILVDVGVGDGGRLTWLGAPVIVARGADVRRTMFVELAGCGRMLLGESVVLGRAHEPYGALSSRTRIVCGGRPTIDETLETGDADTLCSPVVAGEAGVIAALTLAGVRDDAPPAGAMQAYGPATLWRAAGGAVEVARSSARVAERWRGVVGEPEGQEHQARRELTPRA